MIKAIFFDFWGTLVENGVYSPTKQLKNILEIDAPFSEYVVRMEKAMMTARFKGLREALEQVCKEFNIECSEEQLEEAIGMWNKSWMLAKPYEEVQEVLAELKKKYTLVLVSNTDNISVDQVLDKYKLRDYFDKVFFSYQLGLIKTDKNFFQEVLNELKLAPEDCVMVGDSIQSDIIPAKRLEINAILVDRKSERDFQPKIENLKELENVINS